MTGYEISSVVMNPPRFRKDKGVTISFDTGEMMTEQKMAVLSNEGSLGTLIFVPEDVQVPPEKIDAEFKQKTIHEREYAVMFIWWKQNINSGDFNDWRRQVKEQDIQEWKDKLKPE